MRWCASRTASSPRSPFDGATATSSSSRSADSFCAASAAAAAAAPRCSAAASCAYHNCIMSITYSQIITDALQPAFPS